MREYACTEKQFLHDVREHRMTVLRDDGVNRHVRFKRPDSGTFWFDLITWPGALCIDGDMGTWVFRRLEDMFQFFRTDRDYLERRGMQLAINPGYWAEKIAAASKYGNGPEEFSADSFREHVKESFDEWVESEAPVDGEADPDEIAEFTALKNALWEEIEDQVLCNADDGEIRAIDSARAFDSEIADLDFEDAWEWRCQEFTFHFIWCCYAIAWGVKTYDQLGISTTEETTTSSDPRDTAVIKVQGEQ